MSRSARIPVVVFVVLAIHQAADRGAAQVVAPPGSQASVSTAPNIVVPQSQTFSHSGGGQVLAREVKSGVVIVEQVATTTLDITLENPSPRPQEAELIVPVPDGAVVRAFAFEGSAKEPTATVLPKADAAKLYQSVVAKTRDPGILEFAGYGLVRSSVFPVSARATLKVRLTYEHVLPAEGNRIDFVLPRSEAIESRAVPWTISMLIKSKRPICAAYSPSHEISTRRDAPGQVSVTITEAAKAEPGPFQLSYLLGGDGVSASLLAYPDPAVDGGYFLLLAGVPPVTGGSEGERVKREVTLVIDRSGSMNGEKIEQARAAALQIVDGLLEAEAFNIIDYSDSISLYSPAPVVKSARTAESARRYIRQLRAAGGTTLNDALVEALRQKPTEGMLPIILFLSDGLPTVGTTSEVAIRTNARNANLHERRIFTFGVGYDVNAPLLTALAQASRAAPTFVPPEENVEAKVSQVYRRLFGPVLAAPRLQVLDADGNETTQAVRELQPASLPDLFDGDQLVVLGQYRGQEPLNIRLTGDYLGAKRLFRFRFDLEGATTRNAFVPRLWASRKIGALIDAVTQAGAETVSLASTGSVPADPKRKELVDEIVKLSTEFGILTEYTAFLAMEGTDLSRRDAVLAEANGNFVSRAVGTRAGIGAVNQAVNTVAMQGQVQLNRGNRFYDRNMNRVEVASVQQITDRAFFNRGGRWIDSRIVHEGSTLVPDRVIEFGSDAFFDLVRTLAAQGRQGTISLRGDILMRVDNESVLIKGAGPNAAGK